MNEQQNQLGDSALIAAGNRTDELRAEILRLVETLTDDELQTYISLISSLMI